MQVKSIKLRDDPARPSDVELIRSYVGGADADPHAIFAALVDRHGPMVLRVCQYSLDDWNDVQDAFQATFIILARKANSIRDPGRLDAWLRGVARRVAAKLRSDACRRSRREGHAFDPSEIGTAEAGGDPWPELYDQIAKLPELYREPIVLCYVDHLSQAEAAERIGCPIETLKTRLARARKRLRSSLSRRRA